MSSRGDPGRLAGLLKGTDACRHGSMTRSCTACSTPPVRVLGRPTAVIELVRTIRSTRSIVIVHHIRLAVTSCRAVPSVGCSPQERQGDHHGGPLYAGGRARPVGAGHPPRGLHPMRHRIAALTGAGVMIA